MSYKDEWLVIEANDDMDETEHREPSEELLFYRRRALVLPRRGQR